jgi:dephospho-CoA kinase
MESILKGSDDGVLQSGLLSFQTLSIDWYSKKNTTFRKLDLFSSSSVGTRGTCPVIEVSSFKQTQLSRCLSSVIEVSSFKQTQLSRCLSSVIEVSSFKRTQLSRCPSSVIEVSSFKETQLSRCLSSVIEVSSFKRTQLSRCPLRLRTRTDPVFEILCVS